MDVETAKTLEKYPELDQAVCKWVHSVSRSLIAYGHGHTELRAVYTNGRLKYFRHNQEADESCS